MVSLLLGVLLAVSQPTPPDAIEACRAIGPTQMPPPITSLSEAQQTWVTDQSVPQDTLRSHLARIRKARRCYRNAEPSAAAQPYLNDLLKTYDSEAELRTALGQFPEAFQAYEEGLSYLRSASAKALPGYADAQQEWSSTLHQDRAYLHYLLGNLTASIDNYLQAFRRASEPSQQIEQLLNVGILHQRAQDYRTAQHYYRQAQQRLQNSDLPPEERRDRQARTYLVQADLLLERALAADFGRDLLRQAEEKARQGRQIADPGTEQHARLSSILSESLGYLGQTEAADRLNQEVLAYARAHDTPRLLTLVLLKRGLLHVQTQRWDRATAHLQEALEQAEALGDLDYQRRVLRALGRLHEIKAEWARAESYYQKGIEVVEAYRTSLTASQWSMTAFDQWREVYRGRARVLLAQNRPREAFVALDRSRARHLQDLRTQARISNQLPPEDRARFDSLSQALTDVRTRLGDDPSSEEEAQLRTQESSLMAARQQLLDIESVPDSLSLETLKKTLAEQDRALVSYFLDDPWPVFDRRPRSVAFVLTADTLRVVSLSGVTQDSVERRVDATSSLFTSRGTLASNAMHFDLRPLHELHDAVYAPVEDDLPAGRPLTIIPDGSLFRLPFSMLVHEMPGGRYAPSEARYVLHNRPTSVELASSLVTSSARPPIDWSTYDPQLAAYGVSEFDTLRTVPSALRSAAPDAIHDSTLSLPSLPGVRDELDALESVVANVDVMLDGQATEPSFRRSVQSAGVLHVASHALVNPTSPLRNAILLRAAGTGTSGTRSNRFRSRPRSDRPTGAASSDGILFLHELQGQQARLPLVVLSGCNTASGTLRGGEGMEGLQYAFRAMGARSTMATLWPVADQASVELMDGFYRHLQAGHSKDVALRRAQLDFLEAHPQKASPFFWAPPVLYGSTAPIPLEGPILPPWGWWAVAFGALVFFLGLGWWLIWGFPLRLSS